MYGDQQQSGHVKAYDNVVANVAGEEDTLAHRLLRCAVLQLVHDLPGTNSKLMEKVEHEFVIIMSGNSLANTDCVVESVTPINCLVSQHS